MALMFGAMQVAKKIPFDDQPELITYGRIAYVSSQLLCLGVFYYCSIRVSTPTHAHPAKRSRRWVRNGMGDVQGHGRQAGRRDAGRKTTMDKAGRRRGKGMSIRHFCPP